MPTAQIRGRHPSGAQDPEDVTRLMNVAGPHLEGMERSVRHISDDDPPPSDWVLTVTPRAHPEQAALQLLQAARALSLARPTWLWVVDPGVGDPAAPRVALRGGAPVDEILSEEVLPDGFFSIEIDFTYIDDFTDRPARRTGPVDLFAPSAEPTKPAEADPLVLEEGERPVDPNSDHVQLAFWKMAVFPPDSSGDCEVVASLVLVNGPRAAARLGAEIALIGPDGSPLLTFDVDKKDDFEPRQSTVLARNRWLKGTTPPPGASFAVWGFSEERFDRQIGPVLPVYAAPDRDGDVRASVTVDVDNEGPPWDYVDFVLIALDADGDPTGRAAVEGAGGAPTGRSLRSARWWVRGSDVAAEVGRKHHLVVRFYRSRWARLHGSAGPLVVPAPVDASTATPARAAAPAPAPAPAPRGATAPSIAGDDVDAELASGDPARIAAGCDVVRERGLKAFAPRLRALLGDGSPLVRAAAVAALGVVGGPSLIVAIRKLESDADLDVRAAAVAAVAALTSR